MVEVMKIMATSSKGPMQALLHSGPTCTQVAPAAGHHQPMPLLQTPGHSRASLDQSLVGSLFLSPGSWYIQSFVCVLQESVFSVLCEFWQFYGGVNGDLLQEGLCHTQVNFTQSPSPCSSLLLTRTSVEDTQTQFWLNLCVVSGSWCAQGLFEPSEHLWWEWVYIHSIKTSFTLHKVHR